MLKVHWSPTTVVSRRHRHFLTFVRILQFLIVFSLITSTLWVVIFFLITLFFRILGSFFLLLVAVLGCLKWHRDLRDRPWTTLSHIVTIGHVCSKCWVLLTKSRRSQYAASLLHSDCHYLLLVGILWAIPPVWPHSHIYSLFLELRPSWRYELSIWNILLLVLRLLAWLERLGLCIQKQLVLIVLLFNHLSTFLN